MTVRVVVVGAGLGGLSAAAHLGNRGHDVTVLERDAVPGGRAGVIAEAGFRLDTGPTVLTMPDLLSATFAAAGADLADFVRARGLLGEVGDDLRLRQQPLDRFPACSRCPRRRRR